MQGLGGEIFIKSFGVAFIVSAFFYMHHQLSGGVGSGPYQVALYLRGNGVSDVDSIFYGISYGWPILACGAVLAFCAEFPDVAGVVAVAFGVLWAFFRAIWEVAFWFWDGQIKPFDWTFVGETTIWFFVLSCMGLISGFCVLLLNNLIKRRVEQSVRTPAHSDWPRSEVKGVFSEYHDLSAGRGVHVLTNTSDEDIVSPAEEEWEYFLGQIKEAFKDTNE